MPKLSLWIVRALILLAVAGQAHAAEFRWTGKHDTNWHHAGNWEPSDRVPGGGDAAVIVGGDAPATIVLDKPTTIGSLAFEPTALHAVRIEGERLSIDDGGRITFAKLPGDVGMGHTASHTIACPLHLNGRVSLANANRLYLGGEKLVIAGPISGDAACVIDGVRHGIVQLTGDNAKFTGSFTVATGSLMVSHSGALGSGDRPVRINSGAIVIGASVSTAHDYHFAADADWDAHGANGNHSGAIRIDRGATLTVKNGGGNTGTWRGGVVGDGDLVFAASGTTFAGDKPNTLTGTVTIGGDRGATVLARADGVHVVAGPLRLVAKSTLRWDADEQIADGSPVTFDGASPTMDLRGHTETMGALTLAGNGVITLGADDAGRAVFADSSDRAWSDKADLLVHGFGERRGSVRFGTTAKGLTTAQLQRIGLIDPAGFSPGTYAASLNDAGELVCTGRRIEPVGLDLDGSAAARQKRKTLYDVRGLEMLGAADTPVKPGTVISVFGDSITWGGGYLRLITGALGKGEGTADKGIRVVNHGINGGGVLSVRDGEAGKSHAGGTVPQPFAKTIAADKADVAVIYIGVNDVWWRKTEPKDFEKGLRDLVRQARAQGAAPVLATLAIMKERVGERNEKCDRFAQITRDVAKDTDTTLVDLRAAFMAAMDNESVTVRPGGAWTSDPHLLAHDGVHPNGRGERIIADLIARGIVEAMKRPAPAPPEARAAPAAIRSSAVSYSSFFKKRLDMHAWVGKHVAVLTPTDDLDAVAMTTMVGGLDRVYAYYHKATGREPVKDPHTTLDGRSTVAVVAETCGAGCGRIGRTGIELTPGTFDTLYKGIKEHGQWDQVIAYEFGRNFWFAAAQLEYRGDDNPRSVQTGYAVFMRFMAMEAATLEGGPFRDKTFAQFKASVEGLVDLYEADPSQTWANTLRVDRAPRNPMGLNGTDLFAGFCLRLRRMHGDDFVMRLWQEAAKRPKATTSQEALDSFVIAASKAADADLRPLFADRWRWPVSERLKWD